MTEFLASERCLYLSGLKLWTLVGLWNIDSEKPWIFIGCGIAIPCEMGEEEEEQVEKKEVVPQPQKNHPVVPRWTSASQELSANLWKESTNPWKEGLTSAQVYAKDKQLPVNYNAW